MTDRDFQFQLAAKYANSGLSWLTQRYQHKQASYSGLSWAKKELSNALRVIEEIEAADRAELKADIERRAVAEPPAIKIAVSKRSDDYHACIDGKPELWGCGRTGAEAIGDMIKSHQKHFNIEITRWPGC